MTKRDDTAQEGSDNRPFAIRTYAPETLREALKRMYLIRRFEAHRGLVGHVQIAGVPDRGEPDGGELHYPNLIAALREMGWAAPVGAEYRPRSGRTEDGLSWMDAFPQERAGGTR